MADQRLNIIFSGDGSILSKTINELEQDLKGFEAELKKTNNTDAFRKISQDIDRTAQRINALKSASQSFTSSTGGLTRSFNNISNAAGSADFALLNFGRILQDAPYGIIGFANNINPAVESLTRLSATAKETGVSVSSLLLKSLTGTGGLLFGVSLITSALQFATIGLSAFSRGFGSAKPEIDAATTSLNQFNEKLAGTQSSLDNFKFGTKFRSQLKTITAEAGGLEGNQLDIFNLNQQIKDNNTLIPKLDQQADQIAKPLSRINTQIEALRREQTLVELSVRFKGMSAEEAKKKYGDPILNVIDQFKDITLIPESALEGLADKDKEVLTELIKLNKDLGVINKEREELVNQNSINLVKISVARNKEFERIQDETIKRARQFAKEFGEAFVVPDLEDSFFKTKNQIFNASRKLLDDVSKGNLKIKLPVSVDFELLPTEFQLSKDTIENFFKGVGQEQEIPITVIPDITLEKGFRDKIMQKLDLRKGFSVFGDFGFSEFSKIDFSNINSGIAEGTARLREMMEVATTFQQAIGQGLTNAFDSVFDSILEGKSVFKALGEALKQLVIGTIKAVAQMLILKAVTNLLFPGAGGAIGGIVGGLFRPGGAGQVAAPSFGGGGGGLRMAVEFTGQLTGRGSDLYGSVSQGQAQIGRVR